MSNELQNGEKERKNASRTRKAMYTTKQSAPVRIGGVLLIWPLSERTFPDHRCSCGGLMEGRKRQTP